MASVDFFYDVVCPYAYLASTKIDALAQKHGVDVCWKPVLLGGIYKSLASPQIPAVQWPQVKQLLGHQDLLRQAKRKNVSFQFGNGESMQSLCSRHATKIRVW